MARYVRTVRFVFDLGAQRFLLPVNERIKADVAGGGPMTGRSRFLSTARRHKRRLHVMRQDFVREVADAVRDEVNHYKADMEGRRSEVQASQGQTPSKTSGNGGTTRLRRSTTGRSITPRVT